MKGILNTILESNTGSWTLLIIGGLFFLVVLCAVVQRIIGVRAKTSSGSPPETNDYSSKALIFGAVLSIAMIALGYTGLSKISCEEPLQQLEKTHEVMKEIDEGDPEKNTYNYPKSSLTSDKRFAYIHDNHPACLVLHNDSLMEIAEHKEKEDRKRRSSAQQFLMDQMHESRREYSALIYDYILSEGAWILRYECGKKGDRIRLLKLRPASFEGAKLELNVDQLVTELKVHKRSDRGFFTPDLSVINQISQGKDVSLVLTHDFQDGGAESTNIREVPSYRKKPLLLTDAQKQDLRTMYDFIRKVRNLR